MILLVIMALCTHIRPPSNLLDPHKFPWIKLNLLEPHCTTMRLSLATLDPHRPLRPLLETFELL